ncbi:class A sortase [Enterococcus mundtii]|uniref:Class A sortase n=1 Tax=Enterococcus mundtii TaxID=53346 RepID=A0A242KUP1_ENTMU|nr:class A sortase [Enterococcus mundtii]OTP24851.1 hypothetical protein A5802_003006 [Enterococcus mundtii]
MIKLKSLFVYSILLVLGSAFFMFFLHNLTSIEVLTNVETIEKSIKSAEQLKRNSKSNVPNDDLIDNINLRNLNESRKKFRQVKSNVIGFITIKNVGVNAVVLNGTTQNNLSYGVTTYLKNQRLGQNNYVLFGHNTSDNQLFGKLDEVNIGSEIKVFDGQKEFKYKVMEKKIIGDTNFDVLKESKQPIITLIACDKYEETNKRLVVIGKYENTEPIERFATVMSTYTRKNNKFEKTKIYMRTFIYLLISLFFYVICFWYVGKRSRHE